VEQTLVRIGKRSALPAALPAKAGLVPVAA
jgi:hypothetical protein